MYTHLWYLNYLILGLIATNLCVCVCARARMRVCVSVYFRVLAFCGFSTTFPVPYVENKRNSHIAGYKRQGHVRASLLSTQVSDLFDVELQLPKKWIYSF